MTNIYDFFDDILCINLEYRNDRKLQSQEFFQKLNIPAKFFTVKKHEKGGRYGCFDSHIKVLQYAYDNDYENILVFEDDFIPTIGYDENIIKNAIEFMQTNKDWDIFYLGYSFIKFQNGSIRTIFNSPNYEKNIIQFNPLLTHALCYNKRAIKNILDTYDQYIGIIQYDEFLAYYSKINNYCILPLMFDQNWLCEYDNESINMFEFIIRSLYPLWGYTYIHYYMSLIRYYIHIIYIILICICIIYFYIRY